MELAFKLLKKVVGYLIGLILFFFPFSCFAYDQDSGFIMQSFRMIAVLVFVIALIYVIFRLILPKFFKVGYGASGAVKVLARCPLEIKKTIYVIEACEKYFLIGVTENGMTNLGEVDAEYAKEKLLAKA